MKVGKNKVKGKGRGFKLEKGDKRKGKREERETGGKGNGRKERREERERETGGKGKGDGKEKGGKYLHQLISLVEFSALRSFIIS